MGLQRQFDRHGEGRFPEEHGSGGKSLEAMNEQLYDRGVVLHATKGFRKINERRSRVQMLMAEQSAGEFPYPFKFRNPLPTLAVMRKFIQTGLWK